MSLELRAIVEGLIFASSSAVSAKQIAEVTGREIGEIQGILDDLKESYERVEHGFQLATVAHGYQFRTKAELKDVMAQFHAKKPTRLTQAALEVLAIVSYKQPVTRPEIERFRGVDCSSVLKALLDRELVEIQGRSDLPGNPVIYKTSPKFLEWFQIRSLEDLPPLAEFADMAEAREEGQDFIGGLTKDAGFQAEVAEIDDSLQELGRNKGIEIPWEAKPDQEVGAAEDSENLSRAVSKSDEHFLPETVRTPLTSEKSEVI